jgi:hypothetical protein
MGANNATRRIVRRDRKASGKRVAIKDLRARDAAAGTLGGGDGYVLTRVEHSAGSPDLMLACAAVKTLP